MNVVVPFPARVRPLAAVADVYTAGPEPDGHDVFLWDTDDRDAGFVCHVASLADALALVAKVGAILGGRA